MCCAHRPLRGRGGGRVLQLHNYKTSFSFCGSAHRHRVMSAAAPRLTPHHSADRQYDATEIPVPLNCLKRVVTTTRLEPTHITDERRYRGTVHAVNPSRERARWGWCGRAGRDRRTVRVGGHTPLGVITLGARRLKLGRTDQFMGAKGGRNLPLDRPTCKHRRTVSGDHNDIERCDESEPEVAKYFA
jgi:hypothetical protein